MHDHVIGNQLHPAEWDLGSGWNRKELGSFGLVQFRLQQHICIYHAGRTRPAVSSIKGHLPRQENPSQGTLLPGLFERLYWKAMLEDSQRDSYLERGTSQSTFIAIHPPNSWVIRTCRITNNTVLYRTVSNRGMDKCYRYVT